MKIKYTSYLIVLMILISACCNKNPIWDRFIKNPNVTLEAYGDFPYVNFKNEISYGHSFRSPGRTAGTTIITAWGAKITQKFSNAQFYSSGRIKEYNEKRIYENGGTYNIHVYDIHCDWVTGPYGDYFGVISFKANVDGCEYSGLDKRYP